MRLTNLANTANFAVNQGTLRVDDISTNGVGSGTVRSPSGPCNTAVLRHHDQESDAHDNAAIQVLTDGVNLTFSGTINNPAASRCRAYGPFIAGARAR